MDAARQLGDWRPIDPVQDLDAWFAMRQASEEADQAAERFDAEDLAEELSYGDNPDPNLDTFLLEQDGTLVAAGGVRFRQGADALTAYTFGDVHPAHRRRGYGGALLDLQLARARQGIAEQGRPGGVWRIIVDFEERLVDREALCRSRELVPLRWFHDMKHDLSQPIPEVAQPAGLTIAPWAQNRDEQVRMAHNEAFAGHWGSGPRTPQMWRDHVTQHRSFQRDWSWVAVDDVSGELAGYVLSQTFPSEWRVTGRTNSWIGLVGVRPAWRGRRLAPALLAAAMHSADQAGMQDVALNVDAENANDALALYTGMGFTTTHRAVYSGVEGQTPTQSGAG